MTFRYTYTYLAKTVVCNADGKLLALTRSATDPASPGRIDLPGGGVDEGESYVAAAAREIAEESGLSVSTDQLHLAYTMTKLEPASQRIIVRFLFVTHVDDDKVILSHEHDAFVWLAPEEFRAAFADTTWGEAIEFLASNHLLK